LHTRLPRRSPRGRRRGDPCHRQPGLDQRRYPPAAAGRREDDRGQGVH